MRPIGFAILVFIVGALVAFWAPWRSPPVISPPPPLEPHRLTDWDRGVLLCDREVDTLLHSKDWVEIRRAEIIVRLENCDIEKRL